MHSQGLSCRIIIIWVWALFFSVSFLYAAEPPQPLEDLVRNGGFISTSSGRILEAHRKDERFIPASTMKIVTSLAALKVLGPSYRFKTEFFLESGYHLVIRGHGDPFLTSEYISKIGRQLREKGINRIDRITIDDSLFALENPVPDGSSETSNPYDAQNGALMVNFNSLPVVCNEGSSVSSEPQTPFLPLMQEVCNSLPEGSHRVNVSAFSKTGHSDYSLRYSCELFTAIFREQGIETAPLCNKGSYGGQGVPLYTYFGEKSTADLVAACLEYSNNYLANQLFLSCGAEVFGYPATWSKGQRLVEKVLSKDLGIDITGMTLYEGSGLSLKNRISPSFMVSVLEAFKPYSSLLPLQDRILIKSGTMTGIYCYAGYFLSGIRLDPFVILLNQPYNTRKDILKELYRKYLATDKSLPTEKSR